MINKKILYGIGIGILGARIYPKVKKDIKPIARKIIKNAIIISENTKAFVNEVTEEIKKESNIYDSETKKGNQDELKLLEEEQKHAFRRITELKRQLEDVSKKVDNL